MGDDVAEGEMCRRFAARDRGGPAPRRRQPMCRSGYGGTRCAGCGNVITRCPPPVLRVASRLIHVPAERPGADETTRDRRGARLVRRRRIDMLRVYQGAGCELLA